MYFGTQIFINNKKVFKFGKEEIDIERAEQRTLMQQLKKENKFPLLVITTHCKEREYRLLERERERERLRSISVNLTRV